ncbi:hypothetical protein GTR00_17495, partial [Kineococcus sp. T90]
MRRSTGGTRGRGGAGRDEGLTALEVLVGVTVLGVLTAAAAPQYQELRRGAWAAAATADARQAALLVAGSDSGVAPAAPVLLSDPASVPAEYADFRASSGVGTAVAGVAAGAGGPAGSCVASHHPAAGAAQRPGLRARRVRRLPRQLGGGHRGRRRRGR